MLLTGRTVLSIGAAWIATACNAGLTTLECEQLLDRYTELLLREHRPDVNELERLRIHEETRGLAARDPAFAKCGGRVSRQAFDCAMRAQNPDELERCLL